MTNTDRLRALMREHKLTRAKLADLLSDALGETVSIHTVNSWLLPTTSRAARGIPTAKLKLLELALARKP